MKKRVGLYLLITIIFLMISYIEVFASQKDRNTFSDEFDYTQIQEAVDNTLSYKNSMNFESYVQQLISGEEPFSVKGVFDTIKTMMINEIKDNFSIIIQLISIAIIAAVFTNFTNVFANNQVAETGFYVTYLLMFAVLTGSFYTATLIAKNTLLMILEFMKALIPTYFLSVAFCAGGRTSFVFYESTLFLITLVDLILIKIIIPMINVYIVVVLSNNLSKEDLLSKLAELLLLLINGVLKSLLALVIGFNSIQGLIVPVADSVKNSLIFKATGAIPGVGNSIDAVAKTVLGAGMLVKNAIGVSGLIVIIVICAVPVIKLCVIAIIYKLGAAIVQPISDKRILSCINATAEASLLLFKTLIIGALLFIFTIVIILTTTNTRLLQ